MMESYHTLAYSFVAEFTFTDGCQNKQTYTAIVRLLDKVEVYNMGGSHTTSYLSEVISVQEDAPHGHPIQAGDITVINPYQIKKRANS